MIIDCLSDLPDIFKDGIRGVMLLHRNKDGETGNAQRKVIKRISRNKEEWHQIVHEFKELQQASYPAHRIYSSVNSRNMEKAIHQFKLRAVSVDYGNKEELTWFYVDIQNMFFSCLMNPGCRAQNNFIIDCDTQEEYQKAKELLPPEYFLYEYPTKNGRHIISRPFNPNEIKIEVKKDDLILIGYL